MQDKILIAEERAFDLYRLKECILFFDYRDNIEVELEDVKTAFDLYEKHSEHYSCKVLIAFGKFSMMTLEAREYNENKSMPTPALAIVIHGLAHRMIARFYQILRKDKHPLSFFKHTDDALKWLHAIDSELVSDSKE